jgi:hypothetical protein
MPSISSALKFSGIIEGLPGYPPAKPPNYLNYAAPPK